MGALSIILRWFRNLLIRVNEGAVKLLARQETVGHPESVCLWAIRQIIIYWRFSVFFCQKWKERHSGSQNYSNNLSAPSVVLCVVWQRCQPHWHDFLFAWPLLQVLRYFDYVFTGVFTFEMIIKVSDCQLACYMKTWLIILCKLTFDEQILWGLSDTGLLTHLPRAHWKLKHLHEFKSIPRLFVLPSTRLETECSFFNWNTGTWNAFNE